LISLPNSPSKPRRTSDALLSAQDSAGFVEAEVPHRIVDELALLPRVITRVSEGQAEARRERHSITADFTICLQEITGRPRISAFPDSRYRRVNKDHPRSVAAFDGFGAIDEEVTFRATTAGDLKGHLIPGDLGPVIEPDATATVAADLFDDSDNGRLNHPVRCAWWVTAGEWGRGQDDERDVPQWRPPCWNSPRGRHSNQSPHLAAHCQCSASRDQTRSRRSSLTTNQGLPTQVKQGSAPTSLSSRSGSRPPRSRRPRRGSGRGSTPPGMAR